VPPSAARFKLTELQLANHHQPVLETVRQQLRNGLHPAFKAVSELGNQLDVRRSVTVLLQHKAAETGSA
jgi:hypothetical protein